MFSHVIGHDRIKQQLERDVSSGQLHQSYLFAGPEHVGKMMLFREFMAKLRTGKAYDEKSPFGQQVLAGLGLGLMILADDGESLKVEEVRKIVEFVSRRTEEGQHSFCVIEHVERMTISAANALLKVLEEPSHRLIFLMTTRAEHQLLPTVLSRVQLFRFGMVSQSLVRSCLEQRVSNQAMIDEVMRLAMGRIGLALTLLQDEERLERLRELYDYAMLMLEKDLVDRFALADHLTKKEVTQSDLEQFLAYFAIKLQKEGIGRFESTLSRLQELKQLFSGTQVNKRLFLEDLMLLLEKGVGSRE